MDRPVRVDVHQARRDDPLFHIEHVCMLGYHILPDHTDDLATLDQQRVPDDDAVRQDNSTVSQCGYIATVRVVWHQNIASKYPRKRSARQELIIASAPRIHT